MGRDLGILQWDFISCRKLRRIFPKLADPKKKIIIGHRNSRDFQFGQCAPPSPSSTAAGGEDERGSGDKGEDKRQSGAAKACGRTYGTLILKHEPRMLSAKLICPGKGSQTRDGGP